MLTATATLTITIMAVISWRQFKVRGKKAQLILKCMFAANRRSIRCRIIRTIFA